jgi:hypothetical protein
MFKKCFFSKEDLLIPPEPRPPAFLLLTLISRFGYPACLRFLVISFVVTCRLPGSSAYTQAYAASQRFSLPKRNTEAPHCRHRSKDAVALKNASVTKKCDHKARKKLKKLTSLKPLTHSPYNSYAIVRIQVAMIAEQAKAATGACAPLHWICHWSPWLRL